MCQCADGSYASGWPNMVCSGGQQQQQSICPADYTYCANVHKCCGAGSYCSKYGCTPHGADDCGNGFCNPGTRCWTAPEDVIDLRRGEITCVTEEQRSYYEKLIADRREAAVEKRAAERKKREDEAAASRRAEEQRKVEEEARKQTLKRQLEEKARQAKLAADDAARRKVSEQLRISTEKSREAEYQKLRQAKSVECQLVEIGWGTGSPEATKTCGSRATTASAPATSAAPTQQQLQWLKENAVHIQPEQRKLSALTPQGGSILPPAVCSTFPNSSNNRGGCPTQRELEYAAQLRAEEEKKQAALAEELRRIEAERERAARLKRQQEYAEEEKKRQAEAERHARHTESKSDEDCGWGLNVGRQALCGGNGIWCTIKTFTRSCETKYVLGV